MQHNDPLARGAETVFNAISGVFLLVLVLIAGVIAYAIVRAVRDKPPWKRVHKARPTPRVREEPPPDGPPRPPTRSPAVLRAAVATLNDEGVVGAVRAHQRALHGDKE